MIFPHTIKYTGIATASILLALGGQSHASGFQIIEHGVSGLGTAFAGRSASAIDATTVFFNPAGMTYLKGSQAIAAGHYIVPSSKYSDKGSYVNPLATGGVPIAGSLPGDTSDDAGASAFVPNAYFSTEVTDSIFFGLGINAPFGLATEYDDDWVGRYHAVTSELKTVNINPSMAFKVNNRLSLGAGISLQYIDAKLTNAIDFGSICVGALEPALGAGSCAGLGISPLASDGEVEVEGDSWAFGYNLGLIFQATDATRLGLSYRSKISHDLEGTGDFTVPTALIAPFSAGAGGIFQDTDVEAGVDLPETVSLSIFHQVNPKLAIMADVAWTRWSRFDELRIEFDNPAQPDSVQPENWDDTMRYSLGASYQANDNLVLRAGVAYDETPMDDEDRTARIPGNDRTWVTFGAGYQVSDSMTIDLAYAHLFIDDTPIDSLEHATGHQLVGEYEADVDIFSAQAIINF